jgi:hypothetical protein
VLAVALLAVPVAWASSGGLDARGGHHCRTNCASKGYYTNEYHCHRAPCGKADIRLHRRHGH